MMYRVFTACFGMVSVAGLILSMQACGQAPSPQTGSGKAGLDAVQSLDVYKAGSTVHLLLAGQQGKRMALRYLKTTDGGENWSKPVTVPTGDRSPFPVHRGNDIQIAASGDHVVVLWVTRDSEAGGISPLASAISDDGGRSWRPGPDPGGTDHRVAEFVDLSAGANGMFHAVWLDSSTGQQGLHYARSSDGGLHWRHQLVIDQATCECCWNTLRTGSDGRLYVLYRNIDPRDMGLAVSTDDGQSWQRRGPVGAFEWYYKACPITGGGLVVTDEAADSALHAVVWTGKQGRVGLHYLTSGNGGRSWKLSRRFGDTRARHGDIAAIDAEHIAVVWDTATAPASAILVSKTRDGGNTWSKPEKLSAAKTDATHPRIIAVKGGYLVFWTQADGTWQRARIAG